MKIMSTKQYWAKEKKLFKKAFNAPVPLLENIMKEKKRNPNDATFRNINALKKRMALLEKNFYVLYNSQECLFALLSLELQGTKIKGKK